MKFKYEINVPNSGGSRVFDRLFQVLDRQTENKFTKYLWYVYYYYYYKGKRSGLERSIGIGFNKDDALKDFKHMHPYHPSQGLTIVKMELAPNNAAKWIGEYKKGREKLKKIRKKVGDDYDNARKVKRFYVPKAKINTLSYLLMEFLDSNKKSETQKFGTDEGFSYTLTFQRLSKDDMRVIYTANKQGFSMVLRGINITNKARFAEKIAQKIDAINRLRLNGA